MAEALSVDLRVRVVATIEGGVSCRQAVGHFGVSVTNAIRWRQQMRERGDMAPRQQGGDQKS